jgi:type I restriction enzyme S subunit
MIKSYEKYIHLNEFWLNNVPQHWEQHKIKHVLTERSEKGFPQKPLLAATQNMGVVPKAVYGNRTVEATKDLHLLKLVKIGDFVISLRSFQGGIEYAYYEGIISPAYNILTPKNKNYSGYLRYLFKTIDFIELLKNCVTGIREGQNVDYLKLRDHIIPIPSISEQDQIVNFLDWKTGQINRYLVLLCGKPNVEPKEIKKFSHSLIALLIEYRSRIISDVVTGKIDVRNVKVPEFEYQNATEYAITLDEENDNEAN